MAWHALETQETDLVASVTAPQVAVSLLTCHDDGIYGWFWLGPSHSITPTRFPSNMGEEGGNISEKKCCSKLICGDLLLGRDTLKICPNTAGLYIQ